MLSGMWVYLPVAQCHHPSGAALGDQIRRQIRVAQCHHPVQRVRRARAHQVTELLVDDVFAGVLLDQVTGDLSDAAELLVPVGVFNA